MIRLDGVENRVRLVRVAIEAGAKIVGRGADARELGQKLEAAFERQMVFEGLRHAERGEPVVADAFNVGGGLGR